MAWPQSRRTNVAVVVIGNRIVAVRDRDAADLPAGAKHIDLGTATLLPGLIDTHTHIFLQGEVPADGGYDVQLLKQSLSFRAARAVVSHIAPSSRDSRRYGIWAPRA